VSCSMATKDFSNKKKSGMQKMMGGRNAEMSDEPVQFPGFARSAENLRLISAFGVFDTKDSI